MSEIKQITSVQNPLIKQLLVLKEKSRERKKTGLFVLEGNRELTLALKSNYNAKKVLFQPDLISTEKVSDLLKFHGVKAKPVAISKEVYQKLAYRETTEGLVALMEAKPHVLKELFIEKQNPLILIAEAPEKPGNIGALLRTADAANLDAVFIANSKTDLYNPNIIRSSVGCVFTNNIAVGTTSEIISYLKKRNIGIFCAALSASQNYTAIDFTRPSAIVVGTESNGLSNEWLEHSTQNIVIPMQGQIDSLNVSVSAAILIFEAKRQRGF